MSGTSSVTTSTSTPSASAMIWGDLRINRRDLFRGDFFLCHAFHSILKPPSTCSTWPVM
jgi:hypothetical protein